MTENHGYRIAVCMNGELQGLPQLTPDFGDTTDIESE